MLPGWGPGHQAPTLPEVSSVPGPQEGSLSCAWWEADRPPHLCFLNSSPPQSTQFEYFRFHAFSTLAARSGPPALCPPVARALAHTLFSGRCPETQPGSTLSSPRLFARARAAALHPRSKPLLRASLRGSLRHLGWKPTDPRASLFFHPSKLFPRRPLSQKRCGQSHSYFTEQTNPPSNLCKSPVRPKIIQ